jgi:hypothetical protein
MKTMRDENERREERDAFTMKRMLEADERAKRAEDRSAESHKQLVSIREINMRREKEKEEQLAQDRQELDDLRDAYLEANPGVAEDPVKFIALNSADSRKEFNAMIKKYGDLTPAQLAERSKAFQEQGLYAQLGSKGQVHGVTPIRTEEKPSKRELADQVEQIVLGSAGKLDDLQMDAGEAQRKHQKFGVSLRQILSDPGSTPEEKEEAIEDYRESALEVRKANRDYQILLAQTRGQARQVGGADLAGRAMSAFAPSVAQVEAAPVDDSPAVEAGLSAEERAAVDAMFEQKKEERSDDENAKRLAGAARGNRR